MSGLIDVLLGVFILLIFVIALWALNPIYSILLLILGGVYIYRNET